MLYKNNEINAFLKLGTTISIIAILLIIWLFVAKIDVIAETSGKIIPEGKNQSIAVLETSSIEKVLVKEGDNVVKGQEVALLDNINTTANYQQIIDELELNNLRKRAIEAQLYNKKFIKNTTDNESKFIQIQSEINSRKITYESNLLALQAESLQVKNEIMSNKTNIEKLEKSKMSWEKQNESYRKLKENGFASSLMADEKIREANEKIDDINIQKQYSTVSDAKLKQTQFKLEVARNDYTQQLLKEKNELDQKIQSLEQEKVKSTHNINIRRLTSPIDGIVKEVMTNSPKAVVNEGNILMTIVPKNDVLKADVMLKNTDIGFIEKGQKVKLKIETYAFQKYGLIEGKIEKISPDAIEDKDTKQSFYQVIINLDKNYIEKDNKKYFIKPGMTVSADIILTKRSIFEYLVSPVKKTVLESAHER